MCAVANISGKLLLCVLVAFIAIGDSTPLGNVYRSKAYLGGTFQLTCSLGAEANTRWEKPLGNVVVIGHVLDLKNVKREDAGLYLCVSDEYIDGKSVTRTLDAELVVEESPRENQEVFRQPAEKRYRKTGDKTIELFETEFLYTNCRSTFGYGYDEAVRWVRPDGAVVRTDDRLFIESATKKDEGEYICQVMDRSYRNVLASHKITIVVKTPEMRVEILPSEKLAINGLISRRCVGFSFRKSAEKFFYAWVNSKNEVVSVRDTLQMPLKQASQFGTYQCQYRAEVADTTYAINSVV